MKARFQSIFSFWCLVMLIACIGCRTTQSPNTQVHDFKLTAQVKSKLATDVRPSSLVNVNVNTTNGVVTLSGQVENEEIKQRAEEVARSVPGVQRVNNELQTQSEGTRAQVHRDKND